MPSPASLKQSEHGQRVGAEQGGPSQHGNGHHVVQRPPSVHHDHQLPARPQDPVDLLLGLPDLRHVMQNAVAEDNVKGVVWEGQVKDVALANRLMWQVTQRQARAGPAPRTRPSGLPRTIGLPAGSAARRRRLPPARSPGPACPPPAGLRGRRAGGTRSGTGSGRSP